MLFEYMRCAASNGGSIRSSFTGGQFTRAVRFEAFCHVSRTAKFILLPEHRPLVGPIYPALSAAMTAEAPPAAGPSTARARPLTVNSCAPTASMGSGRIDLLVLLP